MPIMNSMQLPNALVTNTLQSAGAVQTSTSAAMQAAQAAAMQTIALGSMANIPMLQPAPALQSLATIPNMPMLQATPLPVAGTSTYRLDMLPNMLQMSAPQMAAATQQSDFGLLQRTASTLNNVPMAPEAPNHGAMAPEAPNHGAAPIALLGARIGPVLTAAASSTTPASNLQSMLQMAPPQAM